jgi:hypothetical protein
MSRFRRIGGDPLVLPLLLLAGYLVARPPVADLAAQVARADVFRLTGSTVWWTGWFAGTTLPTYSVIAPWLMAALGAPVTGAVAAVVALLGGRALLRTAPRPRLGTAVFGVLDVADVAVGRITFAVGLAFGVMALCALARPWPQRWIAPVSCTVCAVLSCFTSPLAGLFTGLACLAVLITDPGRRRPAGLTAAALLACGGALAVLFPGSGTMPTTVADVVPALAVTAAVAVLSRPPVVRVGALLTAAATIVFTVMPGAVGVNMTRMAWVLGAPLVIAYSRPSLRGMTWGRRWTGAALALTTAAAGLAPAVDVANQLHASTDASAGAAFYRPLLQQLTGRLTADPGSLGERVEVVDPRTHWSAVYVAGKLPLARGWDRQADAALNPIFYRPNALTAASYVRWLDSLAVGWVALPRTALDYAAVAEGKLVSSGVPGLSKAWQDDAWTLYRVTHPTPLASGARVLDVAASGVTIAVPRGGAVLLRFRWTPTLSVENAESGSPLAVCAIATADGMTNLDLPPGRWTIAPDVLRDAASRLTDACGEAGRG